MSYTTHYIICNIGPESRGESITKVKNGKKTERTRCKKSKRRMKDSSTTRKDSKD